MLDYNSQVTKVNRKVITPANDDVGLSFVNDGQTRRGTEENIYLFSYLDEFDNVITHIGFLTVFGVSEFRKLVRGKFQ